jgi:hypothetical protein
LVVMVSAGVVGPGSDAVGRGVSTVSLSVLIQLRRRVRWAALSLFKQMFLPSLRGKRRQSPCPRPRLRSGEVCVTSKRLTAVQSRVGCREVCRRLQVVDSSHDGLAGQARFIVSCGEVDACSVEPFGHVHGKPAMTSRAPDSPSQDTAGPALRRQ